MNLLKKIIVPSRSPLKINYLNSFIGFCGGFMVIGILVFLTKTTGSVYIMAPFGASCVLAFGVWDTPLSQPRNIIGGHFISSLIGILCCNFWGNSGFILSLSVGIAIAAMMLTKTTHPPAGADPLVIILGNFGWQYLFTPVLSGSIIIVLCAIVINRFIKKREYPKFWF